MLVRNEGCTTLSFPLLVVCVFCGTMCARASSHLKTYYTSVCTTCGICLIVGRYSEGLGCLANTFPFSLFSKHQQQVAQAVERAKQVTMAELNAIIGVRGLPGLPPTVCITSFHFFLICWLNIYLSIYNVVSLNLNPFDKPGGRGWQRSGMLRCVGEERLA